MVYTHVLDREPAAVRSPADALGLAGTPARRGYLGGVHSPITGAPPSLLAANLKRFR